MKRLIVILILLFSAVQLTFADGDAANPKGKVKGAVADAKTKEPLEYATVALYDASDNKLITGTITDYLGHFKIDQPEEGDYYLLISFIGLEDLKTDIFQILEEHDNVNLGNIFLKSSSENLGEVEVVAKRAPIEYKIDKKVINVDKQITAEAGTAVDILENVPSVQVDVEGNVTLRGSSGFAVLIDGKPTILDPSDVLRQIPSSSIENIEIITNPSVKYEPDGATGIINIVTKKNHLDGLSGVANANVGMYGQYGGDFQLSYRMNKLNFIVGANYNKRNRPGDVINERKTFDNDTVFYVNSTGESERQFTGSSFRAGVEYNPTKNDFISLSGRIGRWDMRNNSPLLYDEWTAPVTDLYSYKSLSETKRGGNYFSIDGVYQHTFNKKKSGKQPGTKEPELEQRKGFGKKPSIDHSLKFQFNYRDRNSDEFTSNELRELSDTILEGTKNVEKGPSNSLRIQVDYTLPIGDNDKIEAGMQSRSGQSKDITELYMYNEESGDIEFVPEFSNSTDYFRNIYAAYLLYAGVVGQFGYQGGLRTEYTDRTIKTTGQEDFVLNRWDFFPTIHLSYNLPLDQQVMASYSRRIDRPRGWWLEPFITIQDAFNVRRGNPGLKPEYIDSYDLGYLKKFGENFLSLEAYYRITHNKVERVSFVYTENIMLHTLENVGKDYSLGLEAMLNFGVLKWWDMEIGGNFYNYKVEGVLYEEPFARTSTNWNSRFNNTFRLWKNGQFQVNSRYNSATVTAQGTSADYFTLDAAFKVNFVNKSLSANIQGRDLLGTSRRERVSEGPDFRTFYNYNPKSPVLILTISYRFNNYKANRKSNGNGGDGEDDF